MLGKVGRAKPETTRSKTKARLAVIAYTGLPHKLDEEAHT